MQARNLLQSPVSGINEQTTEERQREHINRPKDTQEQRPGALDNTGENSLVSSASVWNSGFQSPNYLRTHKVDDQPIPDFPSPPSFKPESPTLDNKTLEDGEETKQKFHVAHECTDHGLDNPGRCFLRFSEYVPARTTNELADRKASRQKINTGSHSAGDRLLLQQPFLPSIQSASIPNPPSPSPNHPTLAPLRNGHHLFPQQKARSPRYPPVNGCYARQLGSLPDPPPPCATPNSKPAAVADVQNQHSSSPASSDRLPVNCFSEPRPPLFHSGDPWMVSNETFYRSGDNSIHLASPKGGSRALLPHIPAHVARGQPLKPPSSKTLDIRALKDLSKALRHPGGNFTKNHPEKHFSRNRAKENYDKIAGLLYSSRESSDISGPTTMSWLHDDRANELLAHDLCNKDAKEPEDMDFGDIVNATLGPHEIDNLDKGREAVAREWFDSVGYGNGEPICDRLRKYEEEKEARKHCRPW
ncbi:MAG: hypothetical protein Q9227_006192 [Pyrenula ochraceoflavens]